MVMIPLIILALNGSIEATVVSAEDSDYVVSSNDLLSPGTLLSSDQGEILEISHRKSTESYYAFSVGNKNKLNVGTRLKTNFVPRSYDKTVVAGSVIIPQGLSSMITSGDYETSQIAQRDGKALERIFSREFLPADPKAIEASIWLNYFQSLAHNLTRKERNERRDESFHGIAVSPGSLIYADPTDQEKSSPNIKFTVRGGIYGRKSFICIFAIDRDGYLDILFPVSQSDLLDSNSLFYGLERPLTFSRVVGNALETRLVNVEIQSSSSGATQLFCIQSSEPRSLAEFFPFECGLNIRGIIFANGRVTMPSLKLENIGPGYWKSSSPTSSFLGSDHLDSRTWNIDYCRLESK